MTAITHDIRYLGRRKAVAGMSPRPAVLAS